MKIPRRRFLTNASGATLARMPGVRQIEPPLAKYRGAAWYRRKIDVTPHLNRDQPNRVAVRVDGGFNEHMLPRGRSSDWAHDGGIYRPVQLLVTRRSLWNGWRLKSGRISETGRAVLVDASRGIHR